MTAVVAIAAFGLVAYAGFLDRPGEPCGAISLQLGGSTARCWARS